MKAAKSTAKRDRDWRRGEPAARIELLNEHWHELTGGPSARSCPVCDASFSAADHPVHHGGELYHPDCARSRQERA